MSASPVISGIGQTVVGRRLGRSGLDLTVEACLAAVADAGLELADVDGLSSYPGDGGGPTSFTGPAVAETLDALALEVCWYTGSAEVPGQLGAIVNAANAVTAGLCRHVLCYRTVRESSGRTASGGVPGTVGRVAGPRQWTAPYGHSPANWIGALAQRYLHVYGARREQLAQVALVDRAHAARNPAAVYREPLTLDEYMAARMVSIPLCLYDCDVPVDGCTAFVVSAPETAVDRPRPPVVIDSVGTAVARRWSCDQNPDLLETAAFSAAAMMWGRTTATVADVDVACVYDGISFLALLWLEALGVCGRGDAAAFVEGGRAISLDGPLPMNPHGGQLSAGRTHGFGMVHEACVQLRGDGGERQVGGDPAVAVVTNGAGPIAGCMLLRRT